MLSLAPTWTAAEHGRSLTRGIVGRSPSPWGCRRSSGHRRSTSWWVSWCSVGSRLWFCGLCWSGRGQKCSYVRTKSNFKSRRVIESAGVRPPLLQPQPECNVWISSWPCRTSGRRTWSSCSPRTPARIRCSHRCTLTWGMSGRFQCRLKAHGARWALEPERWSKKSHLRATSLTFGGQQSVQREWPLWRLLHTEPTRDSGKFQMRKCGHGEDSKTWDTVTYSFAMGGWHDLSGDPRLHLLEEQICSSQGLPMTFIIIIIIKSDETKKVDLPFFFHLLVKCSHVKRLQLPQRRCDKFKHCDSEQRELQTEVW